MNIKWLITASAFAFVSVSAAHAADVMVPSQPAPVSPVIVAPTFSWTGFYVGGQIGSFSSKISTNIVLEGQNRPIYPIDPIDKDLLPKLSGFMGGLYAGSNVDLGNGLILGVDTDIVWANKKDVKTAPAREIVPDDFAYINQALGRDGVKIDENILKPGAKRVDSYTFKEKWAGATRVRIGFAAERIMPYVAGGIAYTQLQDTGVVSITDKDTGKVIASGNMYDETKTLVGYTLGAGVDLAMTNNVIVRAEYRYSDFGKKKFAKDKTEIGYKTNDFRVGVAYKF